MMHPLWAALALTCLQLCPAADIKPQIASLAFATNNPTLTTIALEKPFCMFEGAASATLPSKIYLYVMMDSVEARVAPVLDNGSHPLRTTVQQAAGGRRGPYWAAAFSAARCEDLPRLQDAGDPARAPQILDAYLFRVGGNTTCMWDPNYAGVCNPPLAKKTGYRFKYVLVNTTSNSAEDQSLWSDPIRTKRALPWSHLDTWPGRRSGSMIVITSILSSLAFVLLVGLAAAITYRILASDGSEVETRHASQVTQEAASGAPYSSASRGVAPERAEAYAGNLPC
ncbi:uroplakin-3a [Tachyglossus aculeatus]|uniref:uroplakin-3a n=1 Tax=Tachyglossus aculeatus TaxID=9261 RepID=UPI0018F28A32|nr:uroplakin-3a [Tachyglossus aculeatus]